MKRGVPAFLIAILLLSLMQVGASASGAEKNSRERKDDEISVQADSILLVEMPTARVLAETGKDESGTAVMQVTTQQMMQAAADVDSGDAVRISIAAEKAVEADSASAAIPAEALTAIAAQTEAELEVVTAAGSLVLSHTAVASITAQAGGDDVVTRIVQRPAATGENLLGEVLGADTDVDMERVRDGAVIEVDILSGGENISSWDGQAALALPVNNSFEEGKGYAVIQVSADKSSVEHIGYCKMGDDGLYVELPITHLSTFVVLAGAEETDMGGGFLPMELSPLAVEMAAAPAPQSNAVYIGAAVTVMGLAVGAAAVVFSRRRKS